LLVLKIKEGKEIKGIEEAYNEISKKTKYKIKYGSK
jgi:hypothetical protein